MLSQDDYQALLDGKEVACGTLLPGMVDEPVKLRLKEFRGPTVFARAFWFDVLLGVYKVWPNSKKGISIAKVTGEK